MLSNTIPIYVLNSLPYKASLFYLFLRYTNIRKRGEIYVVYVESRQFLSNRQDTSASTVSHIAIPLGQLDQMQLLGILHLLIRWRLSAGLARLVNSL